MGIFDIFNNAVSQVGNLISPFIGSNNSASSSFPLPRTGPALPSLNIMPPNNTGSAQLKPQYRPQLPISGAITRSVPPPPPARVINVRSLNIMPRGEAGPSAQLKPQFRPPPPPNFIGQLGTKIPTVSDLGGAVKGTIKNQLFRSDEMMNMDKQVRDIYQKKFGVTLNPTMQALNFNIGTTNAEIHVLQKQPKLWNKLSTLEKNLLKDYAQRSGDSMINVVAGVSGGRGEPPISNELGAIENTPASVVKGSKLSKSAKALIPSVPETIQTAPGNLNQLIQEAAGSSEGNVSLPNEYVKNNPIKLQGQNVNDVAGNARFSFTGNRNAQVIRGNQLADTIKSIVPNQLERQGIFWYKAANGNLDVIQKALDNPKFADLKPQLQAALNLSDKAKQALALGEKYYSESGQVSKQLGTIKDLVDNYQNRIYQPEVKGKSNVSISDLLKTSSRHGLQRTFDSEFDAVEGGKKFATTDFADALAIHNQELAKVNSSRQLTQAMSQAKLGGYFTPGKVPEGWQALEGLDQKVGIKDAQGNPQVLSRVFAAPENLANGLKAITQPNLINKIDALRGIQKYQGVVKTVDLSLSFFHHLTLTAQTLFNTKAGLEIATNPTHWAKTLTDPTYFNPLEQDFAQHGGTTTKIMANQDIMRELFTPEKGSLGDKISNLPILKQTTQLAKANSEFLFDKFQRYLKVSDYSNKAASWVASHPNATNNEVISAKRSIAREVNSAYGGLNWENMGVTKSVQSLLRLSMLAPDWTVSNLQLGKIATEGGPGGSAARSHIFTAVLGGALATEALNHILTGHFTDKNPKGHELEVQIAPNTYTSIFRGPIGDILKVANDIRQYGAGGTFKFLQGKLSPLARTATAEISNQDYYGNKIYDKNKSLVGNTLNTLKVGAQEGLPVPFGISSFGNYLQEAQKSVPGAIATGAGLSTYYPQFPGSTPPNPANKGNWLLNFTGTPEEKAQIQTQSNTNKFFEDLGNTPKASQKDTIQNYLKSLPSDDERKKVAYQLGLKGYSLKGVHTSGNSIKAADLVAAWNKMPPDQAQQAADNLQQNDPALYKTASEIFKVSKMSPDEQTTYGLGVQNGERAKAVYNAALKQASPDQYLNSLYQKGVIDDKVVTQIQDLYAKSEANPTPKQSSLLDKFVPPAYAAEVAPGTPKEYVPVIADAAKKYGVPANILSAIAKHESGFDPNINEQSGGLGRGMFQIDLGQHPEVSEAQAKDPKFAAEYAAKLLKDAYDRYGNWDDAIKAYNAGDPYSSQPGYNGMPIYQIANQYLQYIKQAM